MDSVIEWLEEIKDAKKREKDFRKKGKSIEEIYSDGENTPFNILYSNTETLLPAIYSNLPRPVIKRRYADDDPIGKAASDAGQRMLEYLIDTDSDNYEPFSDAVESAVLDGLLPGRGVTSIKYNADINEDPENPSVDKEMICADSRVWDRVYFGYATKWSKVPWVAYEEHLTREEAAKIFKEDIVSKLKFTTESDNEDSDEENNNKGKAEVICVYQIWDKSDKTVKYITDQYRDGYLDEQEDPLGLTGFFNCPKPISFVQKSSSLLPTALYSLYENQAKELNKIQRRLNNIIEAIKVRGCYDGNLGSELENIMNGEDNELIPTDKSSTLMNQGGFDKSIWLLPIEKLIVVARELFSAREQSKQVIYEITGISDIIRGQSKASETLGAQKIKETWGTMRLKRLQKEAQRYALDLLKIMLEIAVKQFDAEMWSKITNIKLLTKEKKEEGLQLLQKTKEAGQQPPPEMVKALEGPTWDEVLDLLKNDSMRMYRIDIETNSTLDVEATEDKQLIAEFMNSIAQFMNGINPLLEKGYMDFEVAKSMLVEVTRRYRFGREVEDQLMAMEEPKQQDTEAQMKQIQEQSKQLEDQQKQIAEGTKKLEEEKAKASEDIKKKAEDVVKDSQKLEMEKMKFEFDKKLFLEQKKLIDALANGKQALDKEKSEMEINSNIESAKSELKDSITDHERTIQSMLDKHRESIKETKPEGEGKSEQSKPPVINITNEMPKAKSVKIDRENGQIVGATPNYE